jgi:hypothetical protein
MGKNAEIIMRRLDSKSCRIPDAVGVIITLSWHIAISSRICRKYFPDLRLG